MPLRRLIAPFRRTWPAAAGTVILFFRGLYWVADFWSNSEFIAQKLAPLLRMPVLAWAGLIPDWLIGSLVVYLLLWVAWGRRRDADRPRIVLSVEDDGRAMRPHESAIFAENSGQADGFDLNVCVLPFRKLVVQPKPIHRIKPGEKVELRCRVQLVERPEASDSDASLAEGLSRAFRGLDVLGGPDTERVEDGDVAETVRVTYRDQDRNRYTEWFTISYFWALDKFRPIRLCDPTLMERIRQLLPG